MKRKERIQPRVLKGFRDLTPDLMIPKEAMLDRVRQVFRLHGFVPIDTPALEYAEILLAKGGGETEQQVYRFLDHGDRDVALRYDLTVPFARFAATHVQAMGTPFRRYHIGPVWRGEKPGPGRFREFWQCDFDIIGTRSALADLEIALVIHRLLDSLAVGPFRIHLSDRAILAALLNRLGVRDRLLPVLRAIDKLAKIGPAAVKEELAGAGGLTAAIIDEVFAVVELTGEPAAVLAALAERLGDEEMARDAIGRLKIVIDGLTAAGVPPAAMLLDLSIARGFDYYTSTIFETTLTEAPEMGSMCSGGRYDDLAGHYTGLELPGVGASLGIDRLLAARVQRRQVPGTMTTARALVLSLDPDHRAETVRMVGELRAAGVATELYPEERKIQKQLQYADRRGFEVAVIAGPEEFAAGTISIKDLRRGEQRPGVPRQELVPAVKALLADEPGDPS